MLGVIFIFSLKSSLLLHRKLHSKRENPDVNVQQEKREPTKNKTGLLIVFQKRKITTQIHTHID